MRTRGKAASGPRAETRPARIVVQHHFLVRLTHWLNVPILAGLIVSGLAIYWAAPVFRHAPDARTGSTDYLADLGAWIVAHVPGAKGATPGTWIYDHFSIGTAELARALRLHWFFAYAFMATGLLYGIGLLLGGGFRDLLPRRGDVRQALAMMRYYAGFLPAKLVRRPWPHPPVAGKYNALQRAAYLAIPLCGALSILSGWAMHKPVQLVWLERLFVNYDGARIVHFICMIVLAGFVIPHVVLVIGAGWNVFRSMVTGWAIPEPIPEAIGEAIPEPEVSHEEN